MPENILKYAAVGNASDIHITQNKPAWLRQNGEFKQHEYIATVGDIDKFVESFLPDMLCQYYKFKSRENTCPVDGAFEFMHRRFRANIYYSLSGMNVALRILSDKIMPLEKLLMPDNVKEFITPHNGLIIVAGKTGSGKTTTLASMIDAINHSRYENILTIEEPIEYIHKSDLSRIEQIEVGAHAESFETATIAALRQNPNIILIGEMRDLPTIQNAITLAETGHMVYGTLHAKSITETIDRIILVEILAVTALCGILIASSAISLNRVWQNNQIDVCESELREIVNGFKSYFVDYGNIIISDDTNYETVLNETLETLNRLYLPYEFKVGRVADDNRSVSLISKLKTDPWKEKFKIHIYTYDGEDRESTSGLVVVSSSGVDTKSNLNMYKDDNYGDDIVAIIEPN